jgi:hypothetical protein
MYEVTPHGEDVFRHFVGICNAFGVDYEELA